VAMVVPRNRMVVSYIFWRTNAPGCQTLKSCERKHDVRKKNTPPPEPPAALSEESKTLWRAVIGKCKTAGRQAMLTETLLARDRADQCKAKVDGDGLTVTTQRSGVSHIHPLLAAEERFRRQFLSGCQSLGLYSQQTSLADLDLD
jgi:phage terminase small subunit